MQERTFTTIIIAKLSPVEVVSILETIRYAHNADIQNDNPITPPRDPVFKVATAMFALALAAS
jgi:hypothetical protein